MATPLGNSVPFPVTESNILAGGLIQGGKWNTGHLTYALFDDTYGTWDAPSKAMVAQALSLYADVANLSFTYLPNNAVTGNGTMFRNNSSDLEFIPTGYIQQTSIGSIGMGVFPDTGFANAFLQWIGITRADFVNIEGAVFLDNYQPPFRGTVVPGTYGFSTILHEIGHTLGLKHPHDSGGNGRPTFSQMNMDKFDNSFFTVMSYNTDYANAATPMVLDVLAIQYIYGANMSFHAGNDTYYLTDNGLVDTLWDAGGVDTFDAINVATGMRINLGEAEFTYTLGYSTMKAIAFHTVIENASGTNAADNIAGNDSNNVLMGRAGDDTITAYLGNDVLGGDAGNDTLQGNQGADTLTGGLGNDTVFGGKDSDSVQGNEGDDLVNGNNANDIVTGDDGNDTVRGGKEDDILLGGAGNDTLWGDLGNDTLSGGVDADSFAFTAGSGVDIITDFQPGTDHLQFSAVVFTTAAAAVAGFTGGVLDLGEGNSITLTGITSLAEADMVIA